MEQKLCLRAGEERNGVTAAVYDPLSAPGRSLILGPEAAERHACFSLDSRGRRAAPASTPARRTDLSRSRPRPLDQQQGATDL